MKIKLLVIMLAGVLLAGCTFKSTESIDLGMQSIENSDYEGALSYFEQAQENGEDTELMLRGRGIAKMGLSDYEGAVEDLREALNASGGKVSYAEYDTAFYLATALFKSGKPEEAIETYNAILDFEENDPDAYFLRGKAELSLGRYDEASKDFEMAISYAPSDPTLYINIYECMEAEGYADEAKGYLKTAMELKNINEYQKGVLYYWLGDYNNAKGCLESANNAKGDPNVILYLGRTYEALGDKSYAASLYSSYLKDFPEDANICNQLGLCQLDNGEYQEALSAFQQGIAVPNNEMMQSLKYNEIVAYEYLSNFKQASLLMEAYLKEYPTDEAAKREYIFLKTR